MECLLPLKSQKLRLYSARLKRVRKLHRPASTEEKEADLVRRFFLKVKKTSKCWIWKEFLKDGYGQFFIGGANIKRFPAHAVSYMLHYGDIPKDRIICHKCDNPPCVNPKHLYAGTYKDNYKDMKQRTGLHIVSQCGENHNKAKLTGKDVIKIREMYIPYRMGNRKISVIYNVCEATIQRITSGTGWKKLSGQSHTRHRSELRGEPDSIHTSLQASKPSLDRGQALKDST